MARLATIATMKAQAAADEPVWVVPTLREWLAAAAKVERWLVPGFIPHDSLVLVSGQQKLAFKTWTADVLALAVASGEQIDLFDPIDQFPVLYCQEEGSHAGTRNRLLGLVKTYPQADKALDHIHYASHHRVKLDDLEWRARLVDLVVRLGVKLVIFDALTYMHNGDENKNSEMEPVVETMRAVRDTGASVLFLAHLDKDRGGKRKADIDSQIRGAGIISNAYDMHFALRRYKREDAHIDLILRAREQEEREYTVVWDIISNDKEEIERAAISITPINEESRLEAKADTCLSMIEGGKTYTAVQLRNLWRVGSTQAKKIREHLIDDKKIIERSGSYKIA